MEKQLIERGHLAYRMDGDNLRHGLNRVPCCPRRFSLPAASPAPRSPSRTWASAWRIEQKTSAESPRSPSSSPTLVSPHDAFFGHYVELCKSCFGCTWSRLGTSGGEESHRPCCRTSAHPPTPSPPVPQKRPLLFELRRRRQGCWP